jgi:hypothetical protein
MKRSLILSNLRTELRKKHADYNTEKLAQKWINEFFDELSIVDSSQIRIWQREHFLKQLKSQQLSREEFLQAKSALLFLYSRVLKTKQAFKNDSTEELDNEPGVFRITA